VELRPAPNLNVAHLSEIRDTFDILQSCRRLDFDTSLIRVMNQVLQKFQAEIMHSPPVTMLHTFTCSVCGERGDLVRLIRARNVSEAVLELIATYMSEGVRRNVAVCQCTKERSTPTRGGLFARRA
jgi:hypothetical protein